MVSEVSCWRIHRCGLKNTWVEIIVNTFPFYLVEVPKSCRIKVNHRFKLCDSVIRSSRLSVEKILDSVEGWKVLVTINIPGKSRMECVNIIHDAGAKMKGTGTFFCLHRRSMWAGVSDGEERIKYATVSQNIALNQNRIFMIRYVVLWIESLGSFRSSPAISLFLHSRFACVSHALLFLLVFSSQWQKCARLSLSFWRYLE